MPTTSFRRRRMARLATLMEERRLELGLRWEDIAAGGGASIKTLRDIRNGSAGVPRPLTLAKIDAGLRWAQGSAARVLAQQGDPEPLPLPPGEDNSLAESFEFMREFFSWWNKLSPEQQAAERRRIRGDGKPGGNRKPG